jgi:probable phosphoglycerate mutase
MLKNRYFLMRHGESLANVADLIVSLPENGLEAYGLSELGREQAFKSAQESGLGPDTLVVASDFLRTRHTAEMACQALGAKALRLHEGLRERAFGQLEGGKGADYHRVWARDDEDSEHVDFRVESAAALASRLGALLEALEREHQDQTILLVSHGDPLRFLQVWAAGRPLTAHRQVRNFAPAEIRALESLLSP